MADFEVETDNEVSITMLGGNTCWNSSLGYYYYSGTAPSSWDDVTVIAVVPNTQDGKWTVSPTKAKPVGVVRGDVIQLKYFGADCKGEAQDKFPAGTKIGFVLATNGWVNRVVGYTSDRNHFASSTEYLTIVGGKAYTGAKTKTAKLSYVNEAGKNIPIMSFEDHTDDNNYSDVVIALNPVFVPNIPKLTVGKRTFTYNTFFGFEDQWPRQYDYDLYDIMVHEVHEVDRKTTLFPANGTLGVRVRDVDDERIILTT